MELLRDRSREFEAAGVRVMAASRDSAWSHVAWMQALDLNFPLLSDWNAEAVRGFGIARENRHDLTGGQVEEALGIRGVTLEGTFEVVPVDGDLFHVPYNRSRSQRR